MRSCLTLSTAIAACVAITTGAPSALAADPVAAAREHSQLGTRHYDIGRYEEALSEYEEAYKLKPDPALLYNIAVCHRKLGHTKQALEAYRSFLRRQPKSQRRQNVEKTVAALEQKLAEEQSKTPPPTQVALAPEPPKEVPAVQMPVEQPHQEAVLTAASEPVVPPPWYARPWVWGVAAAVVGGAIVGIAIATSETDRTFNCSDCVGTRAIP